MARRTLAGTSLALAVAALLFLEHLVGDGRVTLAITAALAVACSLELARMGTLRALALAPPLVAGALASAASAFVLLSLELAPAAAERFTALVELVALAAIAALVLRVVTGLARGAGAARPPAWATALLAAWIGPPLVVLALVAARGGASELVALLVVSKVGDTAGYFVGRSIGKSHPFPKLSPGKTTAGCVASLVAGTVAGLALVATGVLEAGGLGLAGGALLGALVNVAAQAGDLVESRVKRIAGVKDSSALCGPSGGLLDVVDSVLLTGPVWFLAAPALVG